MGKTPLENLVQCRDVQGQKGNWDYDPYMQGMYNGLELAVAIFEDREPIYKKAPKVWGKDKATDKVLGGEVRANTKPKRELAHPSQDNTKGNERKIRRLSPHNK